jgi:hypothetical protein
MRRFQVVVNAHAVAPEVLQDRLDGIEKAGALGLEEDAERTRVSEPTDGRDASRQPIIEKSKAAPGVRAPEL